MVGISKTGMQMNESKNCGSKESVIHEQQSQQAGINNGLS